MRTECVNLRERFGERFKVRYEESYQAQHGPRAWVDDPWLQIILCRYGHVFPYGGNRLAVFVDGHPFVAGMFRRLRCCKVETIGDGGELTASFDVGDFDQVAEIIQPRKRSRPNLSPEQREAMANRMRGLLSKRRNLDENRSARRALASQSQS